MQPLDSTVWWLMPARSPGRGDQTDRRAQRSTVWVPRPRAARSPRRLGPHQPRLQAGWGAAWPRGHRQRGAVGRVSRPLDLPPGSSEPSCPAWDCRRGQRGGFCAAEGLPGSPEAETRWAGEQLPLGGKEAGGGREACSPLEGRVGSWKPNAEVQKVDPNGDRANRTPGN